MNILELPEEIILLVLQQVDLQSLLNLYETCLVFKRLTCVHGLIRICSLTLNTLATVKTLQLNSFKDISRNLEELNLCAVQDLSKTAILPAVKRLHLLKTLNISFTSLGIPDLIDIYKLCPTIKNVSVNFTFEKELPQKRMRGEFVLSTYTLREVPQKTLKESQEMFRNLENVEFVGTLSNLVRSQLPLHVLEKANLCEVKFTATSYIGNVYECNESKEMFSFHNLFVYLLDWKEKNVFFGYLRNFVMSLDAKEFEYLIIMRSCVFGVCKAYVSPIFKNVLSAHFAVEEEVITSFGDQQLHGNVVCMYWNKDTTKFDEVFFSSLLKQVKCFFPAPCQRLTDGTFSTGIKNNWSYMTITSDLQAPAENEPNNEFLAKKKRIQACRGFELAFDGSNHALSDVKLSLTFRDIVNPIILQPESDYLKKITYLSLHGIVHYSNNFFDTLFKCCNKLITLNAEATAYTHRTCSTLLAKSINKSTSLKNLRIIENKMEYKTLLLALSQCKMLENIHIIDKSTENIVIAHSSILIEKLPNLYSLVIQGSMSGSTSKKVTADLNNAKTKYGKRYLNIEINLANGYPGGGYHTYDPFLGVFDVSPIKPL